MSGFVLIFGRCGYSSIVGHRSNCRMGRKKYNLCTKCDFRHAAPTGKACTAGDGVQHLEKEKNGDKSIQRGQGPNQEVLDARDDAQRHQNAVSINDRVSKFENDMEVMDGKLDIIIASIKKTSPRSGGRRCRR